MTTLPIIRRTWMLLLVLGLLVACNAPGEEPETDRRGASNDRRADSSREREFAPWGAAQPAPSAIDDKGKGWW